MHVQSTLKSKKKRSNEKLQKIQSIHFSMRFAQIACNPHEVGARPFFSFSRGSRMTRTLEFPVPQKKEGSHFLLVASIPTENCGKFDDCSQSHFQTCAQQQAPTQSPDLHGSFSSPFSSVSQHSLTNFQQGTQSIIAESWSQMRKFKSQVAQGAQIQKRFRFQALV